MKIILEHDEGKQVIIQTDAVLIDEVMDEIANALLALGFHPDSVKEGFIAKAEEYEEDKK